MLHAPHQLTMALNLSLFHIFRYCTAVYVYTQAKRYIAQCDFDAEDKVGFRVPLLKGARDEQLKNGVSRMENLIKLRQREFMGLH